MAEAAKSISKMAQAIAQATVSTFKNDAWRKGRGTAVYLGPKSVGDGDVVLCFKILTQEDPTGNAVGDRGEDYIGIANSSAKLRAMNQGKFLGFVCNLFGVEAMKKPDNIMDTEANEAYKKYAQDLAETIDAMLGEAMLGRGMVVKFHAVENPKGAKNKKGELYVNVEYKHVGEGNDEDAVLARRAELDKAKELP